MQKTATYKQYLRTVGSLSNLFSHSTKPYLYYRLAENLYIKAYDAQDVTRSDVAVDAILDNVGVGLKTYVGHNGGTSFQKIAEFNKQRAVLESIKADSSELEFLKRIAYLRNERIQLVKNTYGVDSFIYHSVVRDNYMFSIHETQMSTIEPSSIKIVDSNQTGITFKDNSGEYKFNYSKSTLYKKFYENTPLYSFTVEILKNPLELLLSGLGQKLVGEKSVSQSIILPLYSTKSGASYGQVPVHSGLNLWNAGGRPRSHKEVYIPIPAWVHAVFPGFLPPQDTPFEISLPDGKIINVKVCQEGGKALMSNPNSELGDWLIDKVLAIKPGQIVTREMLIDKNVDSVEILKSENTYSLNFKATDTYEEFAKEFKDSLKNG
jgi:hypothetical protein